MSVLLNIILYILQIITLGLATSESDEQTYAAPALFISYNLVPGMKPSVSHNEQLPFTEYESDALLSRALEQCLNDHYIFVKIPGLDVTDFQNFTAWQNLRNRMTQASTILSMPNIVNHVDKKSAEESNINMHSTINWNGLEKILKTQCRVDVYNVEEMEADAVPNFMDVNKKLINIEIPEALFYYKEKEDRDEFLIKVDDLIRRICMKFPSPKVGVILGSTTSSKVDYATLNRKDDVINFDQIPDDPKVLSVGLRDKVKRSTRFIFPDITVFDKSRYFEFERNNLGEHPRLSELKDKQWAKDGGKNVIDIEEDDTWLEKKKLINTDEKLYRFGEDESFNSALQNKQFVVDNALWIAGGVLLFLLFMAWDFLKLVGRFVYKLTLKKPKKKNVEKQVKAE